MVSTCKMSEALFLAIQQLDTGTFKNSSTVFLPESRKRKSFENDSFSHLDFKSKLSQNRHFGETSSKRFKFEVSLFEEREVAVNLNEREIEELAESGPEKVVPLGSCRVIPANEKKLTWKNHEGIIFLDWDDTLFPTTWLNGLKRAGKKPSDGDLELLQELDYSAGDLLREAMRHSKQTFLVTNASLKWVRITSKKYLPEVHEILFGRRHENIEVVSARDAQSCVEENQINWKVDAFNEIVVTNLSNEFLCSDTSDSCKEEKKKTLSLLSIGDGVPERVATKRAAKMVTNSLTKLFVFKTSYSVEELTRKVDHVLDLLEDVYYSTTSCVHRV